MQQQLLSWGFGLACSWWFVFEKKMGAEGLWLGLILGLRVAAILIWAFYFQTKIDF